MVHKIETLLRTVNRPGIEDLIQYLNESTFYSDPASACYHGNHPGGLAIHSLSDLEVMVKLNNSFDLNLNSDSMVLVAICHDLCKVGTYKISTKNVKNDFNQWISVQYYENVDNKPYLPHGTKSAYITSQFVKLTEEEYEAIVHHMSTWGYGADRKQIGKVYSESKLAFALAMADQYSTFYLENVYEVGEIPF